MSNDRKRQRLLYTENRMENYSVVVTVTVVDIYKMLGKA